MSVSAGKSLTHPEPGTLSRVHPQARPVHVPGAIARGFPNHLLRQPIPLARSGWDIGTAALPDEVPSFPLISRPDAVSDG